MLYCALGRSSTKYANAYGGIEMLSQNYISTTPRYEFKMVQLPQTFWFQQDTGKEVALSLEGLAKQYGSQGWEFYRIDSVGVAVPAGCLARLFGTQVESMTHYNVVTFRRQIPSQNQHELRESNRYNFNAGKFSDHHICCIPYFTVEGNAPNYASAVIWCSP